MITTAVCRLDATGEGEQPFVGPMVGLARTHLKVVLVFGQPALVAVTAAEEKG